MYLCLFSCSSGFDWCCCCQFVSMMITTALSQLANQGAQSISFLWTCLSCCIGSSILHLFSFFSINTKSLHQEIAHIWPLHVPFPFGIVYTIFIITAMRGIQEPLTQPQLVPVAYLMDKWTGISGSYVTAYCLFAVFPSMSCTTPSLSLSLLLNELSSKSHGWMEIINFLLHW